MKLAFFCGLKSLFQPHNTSGSRLTLTQLLPFSLSLSLFPLSRCLLLQLLLLFCLLLLLLLRLLWLLLLLLLLLLRLLWLLWLLLLLLRLLWLLLLLFCLLLLLLLRLPWLLLLLLRLLWRMLAFPLVIDWLSRCSHGFWGGLHQSHFHFMRHLKPIVAQARGK